MNIGGLHFEIGPSVDLRSRHVSLLKLAIFVDQIVRELCEKLSAFIYLAMVCMSLTLSESYILNCIFRQLVFEIFEFFGRQIGHLLEKIDSEYWRKSKYEELRLCHFKED